MMAFIWMILIGFLAGLIARAIKPGDDSMGFIMTTIVGIVGALVAGFVGGALGLYETGDAVSFIASVIGAIALLFVLELVRGKNLKK